MTRDEALVFRKCQASDLDGLDGRSILQELKQNSNNIIHQQSNKFETQKIKLMCGRHSVSNFLEVIIILDPQTGSHS